MSVEPDKNKPTSRLKTVLQVTSGNFLEMYDFQVFAFYATDIGRTFFPGRSGFLELMAALGTFGAGFLMRPLGALMLGTYVDRHGRRAGLLLSLSLMSLGILLIAFVPGYRVLGIFAPLLVVIGRLIQGFSAGVELGGVSVYLAEMAPPGRRGFSVSWQSASQQVAVIFAALLGAVLTVTLSQSALHGWGWRIPFVVGCLIVPLLLLLRRSLPETEAFLSRARRVQPSLSQLLRTIGANAGIVLLGMMMVVLTTVLFYFITSYTATFGKRELHLSEMDSLVVTLCVGLSNLIWLPVMGALSDRVGRQPLLIACAAGTLLTAYPALAWLVHTPSFDHLLAVELWLSFLYGSYNGAMVVALTEIMPRDVRTSGFSLAYSLATALGGFTPFLATYLIHATSNKAAPGLWLMAAAACGLTAALLLTRTLKRVYGETA